MQEGNHEQEWHIQLWVSFYSPQVTNPGNLFTMRVQDYFIYVSCLLQKTVTGEIEVIAELQAYM